MQHYEIINTILKKEKLTKTALAAALGVSKQFLGEVVNKKKNFGINTINKLKELYPAYFPKEQIKLPSELNSQSFRDLRLQLGYTQEQFAKKLDISQTLVLKYEKGDRNISKFTKEKLRSFISNSNIKTEPDSNVINMPYYDNVSISSSFNITMLKSPSRHVKIDKTLIANRESLNINPSKCILLAIDTNSLSPMFDRYDRIVLDTSFDKFIDGYIFVFENHGTCYIMQVNVFPDKIKCIPINKNLDTFYIANDNNYTIYGLVVPRIRL